MNKENSQLIKERVQVYIDGFNLYFGMLEAGYDHCKWLNLNLLAKNLLKPNQELVCVKYFTSRVSDNPDKQKRQTTYIEALESEGVHILYGQYQRNTIECKRCGNIWASYNEKMTDVNIATQLLIGAYQDLYDMAMLISGDSDLVPPIRHVHALFPLKRVFVAFPPKRHNQSVALAAKGSLTIGRKKLVESQFSETVIKRDGFILKKPADWQ
ncbi:MAG: NYN domain-containing protein [Chlorobiaceae bacterium]|nr:NYN domain-containing protein [Chlorobiaceae bacterium]